MKLCIFGGQYGSEGKGSAAEWLLKNTKRDGAKLVAIGENSPNSGHTCSLGKTRNIPAASYFADSVLLGPDSAVDFSILRHDLQAIKAATGKAPRVYIHENAAVVCDADREVEKQSGLVESISSTGSGSGAARAYKKQYLRLPDAIVKDRCPEKILDQDGFEVLIMTRWQYMEFVSSLYDADCVFECSQGTLLDINWGIYPYCTSRSTLPRVAIERNGLDVLRWAYFGVYRTFPIRTGGPSGPTGGDEISFKQDIGVPDEVATVTRRIRRVFEFNRDDFWLSINLTRPMAVMFTHLDYINTLPDDLKRFREWYSFVTNSPINYRVEGLFLSDKTGKFINHGVQDL